MIFLFYSNYFYSCLSCSSLYFRHILSSNWPLQFTSILIHRSILFRDWNDPIYNSGKKKRGMFCMPNKFDTVGFLFMDDILYKPFYTVQLLFALVRHILNKNSFFTHVICGYNLNQVSLSYWHAYWPLKKFILFKILSTLWYNVVVQMYYTLLNMIWQCTPYLKIS